MKVMGAGLLGLVWCWAPVALAQTAAPAGVSAAAAALESATGPASAGSATGGALGSSSFYLPAPPTLWSIAAGTGSPAVLTSGPGALAPPPAPAPSTPASSVPSPANAPSRTAPAGVSAVGESMSAAGTAVVPAAPTDPDLLD